MDTQVTSFYHFVSLTKAHCAALAKTLEVWARDHALRGLVLLAEEGINATVAGTPESIAAFKLFLSDFTEFRSLLYKDSSCEYQPFRRFKVDLRSEIVTIEDPRSSPLSTPDRLPYLSPEEWQRTLESDEEYILLDTRNRYETELGAFEGAVDPKISCFSQFPNFVAQSGIPKHKKVLMYCTGGIRCEKASIAMRCQGYKNVYQLQGGILAYLEKFPQKKYQGECFVFDHRVALDQELKPTTQYRLCPHCGNPGAEMITCSECQESAVVCKHCLADESARTCSKNCRYHVRRKLKVVAEL